MKNEEASAAISEALVHFFNKMPGFSHETGYSASPALQHICRTGTAVGLGKLDQVRDMIIDAHKRHMAEIDWEIIMEPRILHKYEEKLNANPNDLGWDFMLMGAGHRPRAVGAPDINKSLTALAECIALEKLLDVLGIVPEKRPTYSVFQTVGDKLVEMVNLREQQRTLDELWTNKSVVGGSSPENGLGAGGKK